MIQKYSIILIFIENIVRRLTLMELTFNPHFAIIKHVQVLNNIQGNVRISSYECVVLIVTVITVKTMSYRRRGIKISLGIGLLRRIVCCLTLHRNKRITIKEIVCKHIVCVTLNNRNETAQPSYHCCRHVEPVHCLKQQQLSTVEFHYRASILIRILQSSSDIV